MDAHPYTNLPKRAFWHGSVSGRNCLDIKDVYDPKFEITQSHKIATAGSCFAQHFSRALRARGCNFLNTEPAPEILSSALCQKYNYGVFSARYGNIYTPRQMRQTLARAVGAFDPADQIWTKGNRFQDPLRPNIEPDGFESQQELHASRLAHLAAVRRIFQEADIFVFTLGLTESWVNTIDGTVYPLCPGTAGGVFDQGLHRLENFGFQDNFNDLTAFFDMAQEINPKIRFLLTVSPVPLSATASGSHVLAATVRSKSVLRAVCAEIVDAFDYVDYFPSYELISAPPFKGRFFEKNMRTVSDEGVDFVMNAFFDAHGILPIVPQKAEHKTDTKIYSELQCEEEILASFSK